MYMVCWIRELFRHMNGTHTSLTDMVVTMSTDKATNGCIQTADKIYMCMPLGRTLRRWALGKAHCSHSLTTARYLLSELFVKIPNTDLVDGLFNLLLVNDRDLLSELHVFVMGRNL